MRVNLDSVSCERDKIVGEKSKALARQLRHRKVRQQGTKHVRDNFDPEKYLAPIELQKVGNKMTQIERCSRATQSGGNFGLNFSLAAPRTGCPLPTVTST